MLVEKYWPKCLVAKQKLHGHLYKLSYLAKAFEWKGTKLHWHGVLVLADLHLTLQHPEDILYKRETVPLCCRTPTSVMSENTAEMTLRQLLHV